MAKKLKPQTPAQAARDAAEARRQMMQEGGLVPLWKLPRRMVTPGTPIFATPDELWDAACEYFDWCVDTPIEYELEIGKNTGQFVKLKKPRPFNMRGFHGLAEISPKMWKRLQEDPEFEEVLYRIENVIYTQIYDGGMTGIYDSGMSSKSLGLTDKREITADVNATVSEVSAKDLLLSRLKRGEVEGGESA